MGNVNREEKLKKMFDKVSKDIFNSNVRYSTLDFMKLVNLKNALSDIHNIITMKVTNAFINKLKNDGVISPDQAKGMEEVVNETSANSNGYDVCHEEIIAEVKCNIPVNKSTFGPDQRKGIVKDIKGLLGKSYTITYKTRNKIQKEEKIKKEERDNNNYYKFMVFLDYEDSDKNVRESVFNLIEKLKVSKEKENPTRVIVNYEEGKPLCKDVVYVVFITADDINKS